MEVEGRCLVAHWMGGDCAELVLRTGHLIVGIAGEAGYCTKLPSFLIFSKKRNDLERSHCFEIFSKVSPFSMHTSYLQYLVRGNSWSPHDPGFSRQGQIIARRARPMLVPDVAGICPSSFVPIKILAALPMQASCALQTRTFHITPSPDKNKPPPKPDNQNCLSRSSRLFSLLLKITWSLKY